MESDSSPLMVWKQRAVSVVEAVADDHRHQDQRRDCDQPVERAPDRRAARPVGEVDAHHRALPKGGGHAHEHHPDQREADQHFRPFGRLLEDETREDLVGAEAGSGDQHRARERKRERGRAALEREKRVSQGGAPTVSPAAARRRFTCSS
jgi:hypothetical protein